MSNPETLELIEVDQPAPQAQPSTALALSGDSPMDRMLQALDRGLDPEKIEKMLELQERWERREAEKAFNDAMAAFKGEAVEIIKRKRVHFENQRGGFTDYKHAELSDVIEAAGPALSRHGFSWSWKHKQENGHIETTCILKHKLGHSEECMLIAPYDTSGGKNAVQAVVSTKTYLERHTLKSVTGLAEKGEDDDGLSGGVSAGQDAQPAVTDELLQAGRDAAMNGMESLTKWWGGLDAKTRGKLNKEFGGMRRAAQGADSVRK